MAATATIALDRDGNSDIGGNTLSASVTGTSTGAQATLAGVGQEWARGDSFVAGVDFGGKIRPHPARIITVSSFIGTGTASTRLVNPFTVEVVDSAGAAVANAVVAFTATGATVSPYSVSTDAQGRASTTVALQDPAGAAAMGLAAGSALRSTLERCAPSGDLYGGSG